MRKINIMHLRNSPSFLYGAEIVILSICRNINKERFNCVVACFKDPRYKEVLLINEVKKIDIPLEEIKLTSPFDLSAIFKLKDLLNKYSIDILHCHDYRSNFIAFWMSKFRKVKLVTTLHGWSKIGGKGAFYEYMDSKIIKHFNQVIAISEGVKKDLLKKGIPQEKITVIHNGIDMDYFAERRVDVNYKKKFNINQNSQVIGTVGRFNEEKGQRYFIEAASEVIKVFPNAVFLIVGTGQDEKLLKEMVSSLGLQQHIIFAGFVHPEEIRNAYSIMDIFVLPSLTEALGLVLLEAMAMGIPAIATNVLGVPDIIEDRKTGYLVSRADASAISKAVISLLSDKAHAESMGKTGQDFVREEFSVRKFVNRIEEVYNNLAP